MDGDGAAWKKSICLMSRAKAISLYTIARRTETNLDIHTGRSTPTRRELRVCPCPLVLPCPSLCHAQVRLCWVECAGRHHHIRHRPLCSSLAADEADSGSTD
ncbi:hypothetical protein V2G26_001076 [Clonostachys chloroleuca]